MGESLVDHDWVFDVIHPDAERRRGARARHRGQMEAQSAALRSANRIWAQAGWAAADPGLAAEMNQARAAMDEAAHRSLLGPVSAWCSAGWKKDPDAHLRYMPHALLLLEWENRYPDEWNEPGIWNWSRWGRKEIVLEQFRRRGVPAEYRDQLADLVIAALRRDYRCKDWMFAPLARWADGDDLRGRLIELRESPARLRPEFVLYVLSSPELRVRRGTWQRWLAASAATDTAAADDWRAVSGGL